MTHYTRHIINFKPICIIVKLKPATSTKALVEGRPQKIFKLDITAESEFACMLSKDTPVCDINTLHFP